VGKMTFTPDRAGPRKKVPDPGDSRPFSRRLNCCQDSLGSYRGQTVESTLCFSGSYRRQTVEASCQRWFVHVLASVATT
jgi:hypothetical protein